ncbi:MAG TPA: efflux RND transporter periplasmic adaptor subunit [Thermoguttaceae bacterium]|nr:efflux RND transporter periplasmic adaptor subunit [Thermoguttaceae bacterium]
MPPSTRPAPEVQVARPLVRQVTEYTYFTGRIEAPESVDIQARVTGYLDTVDFVPGADVKKGQRLFLIDPRPYQAALDRAVGQVQLSEARLKLATADYARAVAVAKTPGAISQQDVDKYAAARDESAAAVAAAKAASESARLNVEFTRILSPVDGVVGRNLLTVGNLIKQDQTLLTTVVSENPMYAYFDIDEHTLLRVQRLLQQGKITRREEKEGFPVELGLADEGDRYPHEGRIDFINNRIDPTTGTLQIRGTFPNPSLKYKNLHLLTPGMFVRVRLPIGAPRQAMLVPRKAIGTDQGNKYVLTVNAQDVVEYQPVILGPEQPDGLQVIRPMKMIETPTGLRPLGENETTKEKTLDSIGPQDRVIVSGLQRAKPGTKVTPRNPPVQ